jgi:hypothetical protein
MADTKITALAAITTVDPAADVLPIVDISDTSMAASGTTKKITSNQILGAGGTATLASATITGDLTVDTSTLKVDSTNNRVGIGLASGMTAPLEVQANTSSTAINIRGRADNANALRFYANDGTTQQAYIGADDVNIDILSVGIRPIRFTVNGAVVASVLNGGNVSIANGNVVMATSGKGIDFSATSEGSGTMTSELLNDYEEGTFTPTVTSVGGTGIVYTPVGDTGTYTKIGRLVTFTVNLYGTYTGTFTYVRIALPFTVGAVNDSVNGFNGSTGAILGGRTDSTAARFLVFSFQASGETGIYTGSYNV